MTRTRLSCFAVLLTLSLFCAAAPAHCETPIVTVRVTSMDAFLGDLATISEAYGKPLSRDELAQWIAQRVGLPDLSAIDMTRPAGVVLPAEGMALNASGFVFLLPHKDPVRVLNSFTAAYGPGQRDGNLHTFQPTAPPTSGATDLAAGVDAGASPPAGAIAIPPFTARIEDRYLAIGAVKELLASADPSLLSSRAVPAGSIAVNVEVGAIAPTIRAALMQARVALDSMPETQSPPEGSKQDQGQRAADENGQQLGELGDATAGADASAEQQAPAPAGGVPAELRPLMRVYLKAIGDAVDNIDAYQLALGVDKRDIVLRQAFVARPESAMSAFLAAQHDLGLPAVGRFMPANAAMTLVGRIGWTAGSRKWVAEFSESIFGAISALVKKNPAFDFALADIKPWTSPELINCIRGDMAASVDLTPQGMATLNIAGLEATDACRTAVDRLIATRGAGTVSMKTTKDVLTPEQHTTYITRITLADDLDPELKKMFRGKALETRSTRVGNLAISGTDPLATRVIRDAIGRPEGIGSGGGLLLNELEPFVAGPGFFGRYNIGSFFELARGDDPRLMPMSPALIETLKAGAGNVRFALRADGANATADVAIPLAMLEAIAKYPPVFDADATNENVAGEPPPPDPEEVDRTADEADPLILGREITPPELIKRAEPDYPESAKAEGVQGRVILQLVVEKSGAVSNVKILKSNDERLAAAATEAVRQWGYKPALRNGEPVRVYVTVTVNFKLRKD